MLLVVHLIMIVVLILLGILFHFGKGADLIAGYNTLPAEKKAEYDVKSFVNTCLNSCLLWLCAGWLLHQASFSKQWLCCGLGYACLCSLFYSV